MSDAKGTTERDKGGHPPAPDLDVARRIAQRVFGADTRDGAVSGHIAFIRAEVAQARAEGIEEGRKQAQVFFADARYAQGYAAGAAAMRERAAELAADHVLECTDGKCSVAKEIADLPLEPL
jgi:hypothetical protein